MTTDWAAPGASTNRLAVLMATRNGAQYLDAQLRSVAEQDWEAIDIWASDDGSTDTTPAALAAWASRWEKGRFTISSGPQRGFAANFRSLLADPGIDADYLAFCDQDDLWLPGKIGAAVAALAQQGSRPAMYCARTILTDADGSEIGLSPLFRRTPDFNNAIVQSIAGGNTIVFNRAAHELLREAARRTDFVSHDWFCYLIISGAGGKVIYSDIPHVRYRQHEANLVGANTGWQARLSRLKSALGGRFADWNDHNLRALEACRDLLTPDALTTLDRFSAARRGGIAGRLVRLWRSGVHRQTMFEQFLLYLAGMLGKL